MQKKVPTCGISALKVLTKLAFYEPTLSPKRDYVIYRWYLNNHDLALNLVQKDLECYHVH